VSTEALEKSFAVARQALAGVTPDQLDQPTPCASWTVRDLVNHVVGGSYWFAASMDAGKSPDDEGETDLSEGDIVARYDEGTRQAVAAFGAPGAMEKPVQLPFGQFPGEAFMGLATTDHLVHAWDLARATGQSLDVDEDHAAAVLAGAQASIPDAFRGPDGQAPFGPATPCDASAPAADRLAAFLGREV
jgi:uncharacterized protein (TIGR03086 family)